MNLANKIRKLLGKPLKHPKYIRLTEWCFVTGMEASIPNHIFHSNRCPIAMALNRDRHKWIRMSTHHVFADMGAGWTEYTFIGRLADIYDYRKLVKKHGEYRLPINPFKSS
jgi:hypothetical protein